MVTGFATIQLRLLSSTSLSELANEVVVMTDYYQGLPQLLQYLSVVVKTMFSSYQPLPAGQPSRFSECASPSLSRRYARGHDWDIA